MEIDLNNFCLYSINPFTMSKRKRMENAFMKVRQKIANINAQLENSIAGIRVAKSFTNEDYEIEKFDEGNYQYKMARKGSYMAMAEFVAGINIMTNLLNLLVISLGGYFVHRQFINFGDLFSYTLYVILHANSQVGWQILSAVSGW